MTEREKYQRLYGRDRPGSEHAAVLAEITRAAWGGEYASEIGAANHVTWRELRRVVEDVSLGAGATIVDLGCGGGGPGLWVARSTGARLVGVDLSERGCEAARRRASADFAEIDATFVVADMADTSLPTASADAVISVDSVHVAPDRAAVAMEAARLLRPGGRFVLTTWDHPPPMPEGSLRQDIAAVPDTRPLLEASGFEVLAYDVLDSWPDRSVVWYQGMLDNRDVISAALGDAVIEEAEWGVAHAHHSVHVFIVARRR